MFTHDDGTPMEFPEIVAALLVEEHGRTPENAARLVRLFPDVMVNAMMAGIGNEHRAAAIALEMREREAELAKATPLKQCQCCGGTVERHGQLLQCRDCPAIGDPYTGLMAVPVYPEEGAKS